MDAVAVRERTQAAFSGRPEELHPDADPYMTRAARAERAAWRLAHPEAWHADLESLIYYDLEYAYDVGHEYEDDWTTDPDHSGNGIEFAEYDEDGVLEPIDDRRMMLEGTMLTLLRKLLGNRAESQGHLYFPGSVAERLRLWIQTGRRSSYVKPDLMVFPPAYELPTGAHRDRSDCALRVHEGAPPPELAVEILSVSSVARDYGVKRQLYAALGVREYWICDVGGIRHPSSPVELQVYRLTADQTYVEVPPAWTNTAQDDAPTFWSEVCTRHMRVVHGDYAPRFQWYDENQGRWRDNDTDAQDEKDRIQQEGREVGREEGRTEEAVNTMREFLQMDLDPAHLDRIEAVWCRDGPPSDAARRVRAVLLTPNEWRTLLQVPDAAPDSEPHGTPPSRDIDPR